MAPFIEKESYGPALALILLFFLLLAGAAGEFAYIDGAFGAKTTTVVENKTVVDQTVIVPADAPHKARDPQKPALAQAANPTQPVHP